MKLCTVVDYNPKSDFRSGAAAKNSHVSLKTRRVFSSMAIDQAHEQNNAAVKSDGGAVGLTQNPEALRRWMVTGPEVARMTAEFEATIHGMHKKMATETRHHEQTKKHPGDR